MKQALHDVLKTVCPRVHPVRAPHTTPTPYVTFQAYGGVSLDYLGNVLAAPAADPVEDQKHSGCRHEPAEFGQSARQPDHPDRIRSPDGDDPISSFERRQGCRVASQP